MGLPQSTIKSVIDIADQFNSLVDKIELPKDFKLESPIMVPIYVNKTIIANIWVYPGKDIEPSIQFAQ